LEGNIKVDLKKIRSEGENWTAVAGSYQHV